MLVLPLMEPELDFRIFGMELGPGGGVIEVRGDRDLAKSSRPGVN